MFITKQQNVYHNTTPYDNLGKPSVMIAFICSAHSSHINNYLHGENEKDIVVVLGMVLVCFHG